MRSSESEAGKREAASRGLASLADILGQMLIAASPAQVAKQAAEGAATLLDTAAAVVTVNDRIVAETGTEPALRELRSWLEQREAGEFPNPDLTVAVEPGPGDEGPRIAVARDINRDFTADELDQLRSLGYTLQMAGRISDVLVTAKESRRSREEEQRSRLRTEALYRTLIERVPAIVYTAEVGPAGRWHYVSPRIEEVLGFSVAEWLADPEIWARQVHPDDRVRAFGDDRLSDSAPQGVAIDYRIISKSGEEVWVLDDATLENDAEGVPIWHGVLYDITDRKQAEASLERLATQQASLAELSERALDGTDLSRLMSAATKLVASGDAIQSCVWERSPHGGGLRLRSCLNRDAVRNAQRIVASPDSYAGACLRSGAAVVVDDWLEEERYELPPLLRDAGVRSSLAVVIENENQPFGVLDVHSALPGQFSSSDIHLAQAAANVLASAIQRRSADAELRHQVLHDSLTGLPNRQLFMTMLDQALERARQARTPIAVLFLDLDHFKLINDSLGHHVGDELLRIVAPRLAGRLRPADTVARFGGDEFGMLVEELADEAEAIAIADRIGRSLSRPVAIGGIEHYVTASIGIAVTDPDQILETDAETLVRNADAAMYRAKELGRARHQVFGDEMRARALRRLATQRELRQAIDRDELTVRYQPVVALGNGEVVGAEALVRWRHPQRGLLAPQEFVPVAEESGLIGSIGDWVIEQAIRQAVAWHEANPDARPINIAINISPRQVAHSGLVETVERLLNDTGIDPGTLYLEITEGALVEESAAVSETLNELHDLGARLVLDDFGTGYSSLAYLNRFPLSMLKIDRSFIEKLGGEAEGAAIVEAILAMAKALSLEVVAEGVGDREQVGFLKAHGCGFAQGFLFARPLPAEGIGNLLREESRYLRLRELS